MWCCLSFVPPKRRLSLSGRSYRRSLIDSPISHWQLLMKDLQNGWAVNILPKSQSSVLSTCGSCIQIVDYYWVYYQVGDLSLQLLYPATSNNPYLIPINNYYLLEYSVVLSADCVPPSLIPYFSRLASFSSKEIESKTPAFSMRTLHGLHYQGIYELNQMYQEDMMWIGDPVSQHWKIEIEMKILARANSCPVNIFKA